MKTNDCGQRRTLGVSRRSKRSAAHPGSAWGTGSDEGTAHLAHSPHAVPPTCMGHRMCTAGPLRICRWCMPPCSAAHSGRFSVTTPISSTAACTGSSPAILVASCWAACRNDGSVTTRSIASRMRSGGASAGTRSPALRATTRAALSGWSPTRGILNSRVVARQDPCFPTCGWLGSSRLADRQRGPRRSD